LANVHIARGAVRGPAAIRPARCRGSRRFKPGRARPRNLEHSLDGCLMDDHRHGRVHCPRGSGLSGPLRSGAGECPLQRRFPASKQG
jgi:hypothetical protein